MELSSSTCIWSCKCNDGRGITRRFNIVIKKYEQDRENAALWENLSLQTKRQMKGIVGFKIKILDMQAAYKLSQNRSEADYTNIISKLNEEETLESKQMAELMEDRNKEREKN